LGVHYKVGAQLPFYLVVCGYVYLIAEVVDHEEHLGDAGEAGRVEGVDEGGVGEEFLREKVTHTPHTNPLLVTQDVIEPLIKHFRVILKSRIPE